MDLLDRLLDLVAPNECLGCAAENGFLCSACATSLPPVPSRCYRCYKLTKGSRTCTGCRSSTRLFGVQAVSVYDGLAKQLIYILKFGRASSAAKDIAHIMANKIKPASKSLVITHIPTANSRVRQRGYDQAELIARALAARLGLPYSCLLVRESDVRQVGQTRNTRQAQMLGAFRPKNVEMLKQKHVLLIDDVLTTGATCEAAASVLKEAGAKRVSAAVFTVV